MDATRRSELRKAYREKPAVGGVYIVCCSANQRCWVKSTTDISGIQNRFAFAVATRTCPDPEMRREWSEYGNDALTLEVLDRLEKKETQTQREFADDVEALRDAWQERLV